MSLAASPAKPGRTWRSWAVGLLIFGAGMVCGGAVTTIVVVHRLRMAIHDPQQTVGRVERLMNHRLDLDAGQQAEVRRIVSEAQQTILSMRGEFQPRVEAVLADASNQIRGVLRPDQVPAWDQFVKRARSFRPGVGSSEE